MAYIHIHQFLGECQMYAKMLLLKMGDCRDYTFLLLSTPIPWSLSLLLTPIPPPKGTIAQQKKHKLLLARSSGKWTTKEDAHTVWAKTHDLLMCGIHLPLPSQSLYTITMWLWYQDLLTVALNMWFQKFTGHTYIVFTNPGKVGVTEKLSEDCIWKDRPHLHQTLKVPSKSSWSQWGQN